MSPGLTRRCIFHLIWVTDWSSGSHLAGWLALPLEGCFSGRKDHQNCKKCDHETLGKIYVKVVTKMIQCRKLLNHSAAVEGK